MLPYLVLSLDLPLQTDCCRHPCYRWVTQIYSRQNCSLWNTHKYTLLYHCFVCTALQWTENNVMKTYTNTCFFFRVWLVASYILCPVRTRTLGQSLTSSKQSSASDTSQSERVILFRQLHRPKHFEHLSNVTEMLPIKFSHPSRDKIWDKGVFWDNVSTSWNARFHDAQPRKPTRTTGWISDLNSFGT